MVARLDDLRAKLVTGRCNRQATAAVILLAAVVACARYEASAHTDSARADSIARVRQDSINRAQPGYVVDSIFPIEEEIRRFNDGLTPTTTLKGGASSPEALVRLFARALAERDTNALVSLLVSRAEFGYLVFPESRYARPPYKTKPAIVWTQLVSDSERGLSRLLERVSGDSLRISALRCPKVADREGANRYWRNCSLSIGDTAGGSRRLQLFGPILERGGRTKFLSYDTAF